MPTAGIDGQLFVFFIMVVAAAEVSVGLAIIVMMYRNMHSVDVNFLKQVKTLRSEISGREAASVV